MNSHLLTMRGRDGIRIWVHDGLYRIQRRLQPQPDQNGKLQERWESLAENKKVLLFETWQEAEKYINENNIT